MGNLFRQRTHNLAVSILAAVIVNMKHKIRIAAAELAFPIFALSCMDMGAD